MVKPCWFVGHNAHTSKQANQNQNKTLEDFRAGLFASVHIWKHFSEIAFRCLQCTDLHRRCTSRTEHPSMLVSASIWRMLICFARELSLKGFTSSLSRIASELFKHVCAHERWIADTVWLPQKVVELANEVTFRSSLLLLVLQFRLGVFLSLSRIHDFHVSFFSLELERLFDMFPTESIVVAHWLKQKRLVSMTTLPERRGVLENALVYVFDQELCWEWHTRSRGSILLFVDITLIVPEQQVYYERKRCF